MIIELDQSLKSVSEKLADEHPVSIALDLIANANREGAHLIFADRDVASHLLSIGEDLHTRTQQTLKHVYNRYTQLAELARTVCVKLLIGEFANITLEMKDNQRLIKVPASRVSSTLLQKPYLLVENLDDAIFYKFITSELAGEVQFGGNIAFEPYNGGGNTTGNVYDHIKRTGDRLCLCIVDSDRRFPGAGSGETASKVEASDRKEPSALAESFVLPVCSVENLIPFDFLRNAFHGDKTVSGRLDLYEPHHREELWPYFQLKKDIRCADLRDPQKGFSRFWTEKLGCGDQVRQCASGDGCEKRDRCATTVLPPVSQKPLDAVLTGLSEKTLKSSSPLPSVRSAWLAIAKLVSAWSCGGPQRAAG